jgi:hypothetical protein
VLFTRKRWKAPRPVLALIGAILLYVAICLLFIASTGLIAQRFEIDFLPLLLLVACIVVSERLGHLAFRGRLVASIALAALACYGIAINLALAVQGPYDQFVQAHPDSYVKLARWFSPIERFRPLLNPGLKLRAFFDLPEPCPPRREPLFSAGEFGSRYLLSVECAQTTGPDRRLQLVSESSVWNPDWRIVQLPFPSQGRNLVGLDFNPSTRVLTVTWNGKIVVQHPLRFLVTSRSQVRFGIDRSLGIISRFDWPIRAYKPQMYAYRAPQ